MITFLYHSIIVPEKKTDKNSKNGRQNGKEQKKCVALRLFLTITFFYN